MVDLNAWWGPIDRSLSLASNQDGFVCTDIFSSEVRCRVDHRLCTRHIRAATGAAITLGICLALIRYSLDSVNVQTRDRNDRGEVSGCLPGYNEFANVIAYSSSAK